MPRSNVNRRGETGVRECKGKIIRICVVLVENGLEVFPKGSLTESSYSWYVQYTRISGLDI